MQNFIIINIITVWLNWRTCAESSTQWAFFPHATRPLTCNTSHQSVHTLNVFFSWTIRRLVTQEGSTFNGYFLHKTERVHCKLRLGCVKMKTKKKKKKIALSPVSVSSDCPTGTNLNRIAFIFIFYHLPACRLGCCTLIQCKTAPNYTDEELWRVSYNDPMFYIQTILNCSLL